VKVLATIELDDAAPERATAILTALPRVEVRHSPSGTVHTALPWTSDPLAVAPAACAAGGVPPTV